MSQNDYVIANQTTPLFRADLNLALQALASNSSGSSAPSTTYANMLWYDTANNTLKMRSEADDAWITLGTLDQSLNTFTPFGLTAISADPDFTVDPTLLAPRSAIKTLVDTEISGLPPAGGVTLLATLSTASGSSVVATGLNLTDYKFLFVQFDGLNTVSNTAFKINNNITAGLTSTTSTSVARNAYVIIFLTDGFGYGMEASIGIMSGGSSITTASTEIRVQPNFGNFDGGTTYIWGVK